MQWITCCLISLGLEQWHLPRYIFCLSSCSPVTFLSFEFLLGPIHTTKQLQGNCVFHVYLWPNCWGWEVHCISVHLHVSVPVWCYASLLDNIALLWNAEKRYIFCVIAGACLFPRGDCTLFEWVLSAWFLENPNCHRFQPWEHFGCKASVIGCSLPQSIPPMYFSLTAVAIST